MINRRTNYLIASWGGKTSKRQSSTLHQHLEQLNTLKHSLDQVTIGRPLCPKEMPQYTETIENVTSLDDGTPVVVEPLPNAGFSYGQWSHIYRKYRDNYSHYILIEDDYVPVVDHFDSWMVERFDHLHHSKQCGYLCGLVSDKAGWRKAPRHAAIANGITSATVLRKVCEDHGGVLPHHGKSQLTFSHGFIDSGFTLYDWLDCWRSRYWGQDETPRVYGKGEDIIDPIQCRAQQ
jgi:hypothetical protein